MRRPVVYAAIFFACGIELSFIFDIDVLIWITGLTAGFAALIYNLLNDYNKTVIYICMGLCFLTAGGSAFSFAELNDDPAVSFAGERYTMTGIVREADFKEDHYIFIVENYESKAIVNYYGELGSRYYTLAGKTIEVSGRVNLPRQRSNPGCFDYRLYLKSCGIQVIINADSVVEAEGREVPLIGIAACIRGEFSEKLNTAFPQDKAGLVMAILFGDKTMMDEDVYESFREGGTAHVLAVSGLHAGILYAFILLLWQRKRGTVFRCSASGILVMYLFLADFTPSVVRAVTMIFIHMAADVLNRRYDLLSAAAVTFAGMLTVNPFLLFNTGFQMSFLAIASIAVILPYAEKLMKGVLISSLAVQAGTVPYTAYVFNYFSFGAVFANIPMIFFMGILLPAALVMLILSWVPGPGFAFSAQVVSIGCDVLIGINDIFYAGGKTSADVVSPPLPVIMIYYGLLFLFTSEMGQIMVKRRKIKELGCIIICMMLFSFSVCAANDNGFAEADVTFVDVGQGDCIHIRTPSGKNYLIDGGGSETYDTGKKILKPYLLKNGVKKIDAAFVTHLHEDHYGGIRSLAAEEKISTIGIYEANTAIEKELEKDVPCDFFYLYGGQRVELDEDIYLQVLAPGRKTAYEYEAMVTDQEDENKSSLIFMLDYMGTKVLITGDIGEEGENELIRNCGNAVKCDILKVAHHGSKYSTCEKFLERADPDYAVVQVGRNNYGHPHESVLERLEDTVILRNDLDGAVGFDIKRNGSVNVIKMID